MKTHSDRSPPIVLESASFSFGARKVVDSLNLALDKSPVVILGPSGCGKTTLLRLIAGLLAPETGTVTTGAPGNMLSFVFQEPRLLPHLTILQNVALPVKKMFSKEEAQARAMLFLSLTGLKNEAERYPREISGGQAMRAALARAFCYPAPLLLMDEPFQSLDLPLRLSLLDIVKALLKKEERFVVSVTHDPREAVILGRRILVLGEGCRVILDVKNVGGQKDALLESKIIEALKKAHG